MKITYLKLVKYKRFPLRTSEVFEHTFNEKMTMILGPNGSGKSSLLSELTPLPPSKDDFYKGGSKIIHINHNNNKYVLIADFVDDIKYWFYVNDENLNISNNITTQRELAYQHFNITPIVQEILTGEVNFTDMSLVNRKKLFNTITHLNIDSILDNFNSLKEELKNNEFLLKNVSSISSSEKQKLIDTSRKQILESRYNDIKNHIDNLLIIRSEVYKNTSDFNIDTEYSKLKEIKDKIKFINDKYYILFTVYPSKDVEYYYNEIELGINITKHKLDLLYREHEKTTIELRSFKTLDNKDLNNLLEERKNVEDKVVRLTSSINYLDVNNTKLIELREACIYLESILPDILHDLPTNVDKKYSKDKYTALVDSKNKTLIELTNNLRETAIVEKELKELDLHQKLQCPNCNHTWLPEEVTSKTHTNKSKLKDLLVKQTLLEANVKELDKDILEQSEYLQVLSSFMKHYSNTKSILKVLWDKVSTDNLLYSNPKSILTILNSISIEVKDIEQINKYKEDITKLTENIELIKSIGESTSLDLENKLDDLNEDIQALLYTSETFQNKRRDILLVKEMYGVLNELKSLYKASITSVKESHFQYTINEVLNIIDSELSKNKVEYIELEREINNQSNIQSVIDKYEEQITGIEENIKVLKILTNELSPKNGFIAKTISNFLNVIIVSINNIIRSIWDYKMELRVIDVEEDSLNYKFKVEVDDKLVINDINTVSSGMKEIINLALKITLFKLLKLEGYPIFLDEFGVKLDQVHRGKISDLIFKMINSTTYSQIFLITHLDLAYTNFKDTEVIEII